MDEDYNINDTSEETVEVAEPLNEDEESVETAEVADPSESEEVVSEPEENQEGGRTSQDSAFAEMRRRNRELENDNKLMFDALNRYFTGDDARELSIQANAYADSRDPEEVRAEFERSREEEELRSENEELKEQLMNIQIEQRMAEDLRTIQGIDPTVKSLDDLGESFINYISAGLDATDAYYASLLKDQK